MIVSNNFENGRISRKQVSFAFDAKLAGTPGQHGSSMAGSMAGGMVGCSVSVDGLAKPVKSYCSLPTYCQQN